MVVFAVHYAMKLFLLKHHDLNNNNSTFVLWKIKITAIYYDNYIIVYLYMYIINQEHLQIFYSHWQTKMYGFDFKIKIVYEFKWFYDISNNY